jgi:hypothetical protein
MAFLRGANVLGPRQTLPSLASGKTCLQLSFLVLHDSNVSVTAKLSDELVWPGQEEQRAELAFHRYNLTY